MLFLVNVIEKAFFEHNLVYDKIILLLKVHTNIYQFSALLILSAYSYVPFK